VPAADRAARPGEPVVAGPDAGSIRPGDGAAPTALVGARPGLARPSGGHPGPEHVDPADTPADPEFPTAWAGLLFLLATAERVGVPGAIVDDLRFAARPLPWVLRRAAEALGVPAGDPAVAVFAGADPARPEPWDPALPAEAAAVAELAERWAAATLAVLDPDGRDPDGPDLLTALLHRPGVLRWLPGWAELEMPLDTVDLDVRRAGLDLDPGWVPWLGVVVRYRYG
jgi:hypothetical protein